MAQYENTLGAPTEGLGQTVTFANGGGGGPPQARAGQRGKLGGASRGGEAQTSTRAQYIPPAKDQTLELLHKMGSALLAPHVEAAQTESFVKGMQQVANGQAISEIVDEQPWYSKVFGSTSLVDGARAYSANAQVQKEMLEAQAAMPEWRTKSSTEVQALMAERLGNIKTGDSGTDAMVMRGLMKEMPNIFKTHSKEHLVWQNENLASSFTNSAVSGAASLNLMRSRPVDAGGDADSLLNGNTSVTTASDIALADFDYVMSVAKPESMPQETYNKLMTGVSSKLLGTGMTHSYNTLKKSGILSQLDASQLASLERAEGKAKAEIYATLPDEYRIEKAEIRNGVAMAQTPADLAAYATRSDLLNKRFAAQYGLDEPLVGTSEDITNRATILNNIDRADHQRAEGMRKMVSQAQTTADKAQAEDDNIRVVESQLLNGANPSIFSAEEIRRATALSGNNTQSLRWQVIAKNLDNFGMVDKQGAAYIQADMRQVVTDPTGFHEKYVKSYLPLVNAANPDGSDYSLASKYFGETFGMQMAQYHSQIIKYRGGEVPPEAKAAAHLNATSLKGTALPEGTKSKPNEVTAEIVAGLKQLVAKEDTGIVFDGAGKVSDEELGRTAKLVYSMYQSLPPGEGRVKGALALMQDRISFVGGYALEKPLRGVGYVESLSNEKTDPDAKNYVERKVLPNEVHDATRWAVESVVGKQKIVGPNVRQSSDGSGLVVMGTHEDGSIAFQVIPAKQVADLWVERKAATKGLPFGLTKSDVQFGPKMFVPEPKRSIYSY